MGSNPPPPMSRGHMEASPTPQGRGEDTDNQRPTPYSVSS